MSPSETEKEGAISTGDCGEKKKGDKKIRGGKGKGQKMNLWRWSP